MRLSSKLVICSPGTQSLTRRLLANVWLIILRALVLYCLIMDTRWSLDFQVSSKLAPLRVAWQGVHGKFRVLLAGSNAWPWPCGGAVIHSSSITEWKPATRTFPCSDRNSSRGGRFNLGSACNQLHDQGNDQCLHVACGRGEVKCVVNSTVCYTIWLEHFPTLTADTNILPRVTFVALFEATARRSRREM